MKRIKLVVFFILGLFMLTSCSMFSHESFPSGPQIEEPGTNPDVEVSSYLITYYENGLKIHQESLESGKALPQVESTKAPIGQEFMGWSTSKEEYVPVDFDVMPESDVDLYAFYQNVKYTITFNANISLPDGTTTTKEYEYHERLGEFVPSDLQEIIDAQTEYVFVGWFLDPEFKEEFVEVSMPAEDIVLYAKWQFSGIRFMNGLEVFYEVKDDEGASVQAPLQNPTKPGYDFVGWVDAKGNAVSFPLTVTDEVQFIYAAFEAKNNMSYKVEHYLENLNGTFVRQEVEELFGSTDSEVEALWKSYTGFSKDETNENNVLKGIVNYNGTLVLKLYYSRNSYKVSFETNGGSAIQAVSYKYEQMVAAPSSPNKLGYTFAGWELNGESYSFTNMPAHDIELSAKWQVVEYTVTFVATELVGKVTYTVENKNITEPAVPAVEHFTGAWEEYELTTGNITVKAVYTPVTYTVTFKAEGVTVDTENYTVVNPTINEPAVPTKAHYTGAWESYVLAGGNVEVEAIYTPVTYYVTFVAEGTEVAKLPYTVENKAVVNPAVPAKAHYTGVWESYTLTSGNVEVEAIYTPVTYYVTFVAEGTEVAKLPYTVENKAVVNPAVPAKAHYTGVWESYTLTSGNVEVEAVYTPVTYYVTFVAEGTEVAKLPYTVENKAVVNPAVPEKAHYTGVWESYTLTSGNVEVEAIYTPVTYTVTFKDGESVIGSDTYTIVDTIITEPALPTKAHYTSAWAAYVLDGGNKEVQVVYTPVTYYVTFVAEGTEVAKLPYTVENTAIVEPAVPAKTGYTAAWESYSVINGNITVNAVYTVNQYTISFNTNGGSSVAAITQNYGTTVVAPANPTKGGHNFAGWDVVVPATMPAENITINALWEVKKLEVGAGKDYATITEALQYANENEIITVFPGSYDENLVIDKPITLKGSNAGVNPNTSVRTSETYIKSITIKASNVTVDGFAFADSLASTPLITVNNAKLSNITLANILIEQQTKFNTNATGLIKAVATGSNSISNLVVDGFLVEKGSLRPTFIFASQIDGFTLSNSGLYGSNALSSYTDCVKFDTGADYGVKGNVLIENNIFKDYGQYILWFREIGTGSYEIANNQFINCGQTAGSHGAVTFASYASDATNIEINFHHNILDDSYMMFRADAWASATSSNLTMKCNYNKVSNSLGEYHVKNGNAVSIVDATNNQFDSNPTDALFLNANWQYPFDLTFELNGGHLYYETREQLVDAFLADAMAWAGKTGSKPTCMVNDGGGSGLGFANVFSAIYGIFSDATYGSKWAWLKDYIINVTTNATTKSSLQSGQEAYWRYSLGAFLFEDYRSTWPASEDFTNSEKANGFWECLENTVVNSSTYKLPTAAYKEGYKFVGWYNNPEFTGSQVTTVTQNSVLYAKFAEVYDVEYNYNGGHAYYETIQDMANDFVTDFKNATGKSVTLDGLYSIGNYYDEFFTAEGMYDKWIWIIELFAELGEEGIGYHAEAQAQYEAFIAGNITSSSLQWAIRQNIRGLMNGIKAKNYSTAIGIDFADSAIVERVWKKLSDKASGLAVTKDANTPNVYKEGYKFEGWYDNPEFTGEKVTVITKDIKLYAKLIDIRKYQVNMNLNDGKLEDSYYGYYPISEPNTKFDITVYDNYGNASGVYFCDTSIVPRNSLRYQYKILLQYDATLDAYKVVCLDAAKASANNAATAAGVTWSHALSSASSNITTQVTLGQYIVLSQKVTEGSTDFEAGVYDESKLVYGMKPLIFSNELEDITLPTPTKEHYTFAGWYTNPELTGEQVTIIEKSTGKNVSVYAKWTPVEYTVTFKSEVAEDIVRTYTVDNTTIEEPTVPTKVGYTGVWESYTLTSGNLEVNAVYTINQYKVTFMNGSDVLSEETLDYGTTINAIADPTKDGYEFVGWSIDLPTTVPAEDLVINAVWKSWTYTYTFGANGTAEHKDGNPVTAPKAYSSSEDSNVKITLTTATKVYDGATDAKGNSALKLGTGSAVATLSFTVSDEIQYVIIKVAQYKTYKSIITINGVDYTITTSSNNGEYTSIIIDTTTVKTITLNTTTKSSSDERCMIDEIFMSRKELQKGTISFNSNGGTGSISAIENVLDSKIELPSWDGLTAPTNKMFDSWNTSADGTGTSYQAGDVIILKEDITLYAIWIDNPPVEMTIEEAKQQLDGFNVILSGVVQSIDTAWNSGYGNMTITLKDDTETIQIFRMETQVQVGDLITVTGVMDTYNDIRQVGAGATAIINGVLEITVSYDANGGTGSIVPMSITAGQNIDLADGTLLTAPAGKEFKGWSLDKNATNPTYGSGDIAQFFEDITLYAIWGDAGSAEPTWQLVTDVNTLQVDDQIVIVAKSANYALGTNQKSNNRGQAAVTKSGNTITFGNDVQIITLKAGNVSGTFAFYTGTSGYLYAASSSSNYLRTKTTLDNNGSWQITITAAGVATIKAQGTNTRNWLRYNSGSSLFACYSSGQGDVCIYKLTN